MEMWLKAYRRVLDELLASGGWVEGFFAHHVIRLKNDCLS